MIENTGFLIEKKRSETDFIAGEENSIEYKIVNEVGDWLGFSPHGEVQKNRSMDSMACVSYSCLNCLEAQMAFFIAMNLLPETHLKFLENNGYIFNGQVNFADRYLAKMSETTHSGNYLVKVADSARHDGILPEKDWGFGGEFKWDEYYKEIPEELKVKAKEFYKYFSISYEWVSYSSSAKIEDLKKHLKQAPLQIATPVCNWNDDIIKPCGKTKASHATMLTCVCDNYMDIFDHYIEYKKKFSMDYPVPFAMKIVLNIKPVNNKKMKLYIDKDQNQVLGDENLQFGYSIPNEKKLEEITTHCAKLGIELEKPEERDMIGWYIISGTDKKGWEEFLNI